MSQQTSFSLRISPCRILPISLLVVCGFGAVLSAQNPVPQIVGPINPMAVVPGSGAFTLTVYGANFVPGALVNWNGHPRTTRFVSAHEVRAHILAADVATNTAGMISVTNPPPGGGSSSASWAQVEVHAPMTTTRLRSPLHHSFGGYLLLAADFNHDGILDLAGQYGSWIAFHPGDGMGNFPRGSIVGGYYDSNGGAFGDFNGDGNLDIVYGQSLPNVPSVWGHVSLGDGTGKFKFGSSLSNAHDPTVGAGFILTGDFNRDGTLDVIVSNQHGFSAFLGRGDGTFYHFTDVIEPHYYISGMVAADFNGDGRLDIALATTDLTNIYVYVYPGNGDGTFGAAQQIYSDPSLEGVGLMQSDFNGDGKPDLAFWTSSQICILLGSSDGTFQDPTCYTVGAQFQFTFAIGDINSDGKQDLIVSNYFDFNNAELDIYSGNGDGTFQSPQRIAALQAELGIVLGDFNADGMLDVLFQTGLGTEILRQAP